MEPNQISHLMTFTAPSGRMYTIREQNGADDDILSNAVEARTLRNFSRFISAIVVETTATASGKLSVEDAHKLPSLDRYCIIMQSRIFSIGESIEFSYAWPTNTPGRDEVIQYEQDLNDYLLEYSRKPTAEELEAKPEAIPYYPMGEKVKDLEITTASGKELLFDLLNAEGESYIANLPTEKQTKNESLRARNLRLKVEDRYEKVESFSMFSVKDMADIRKAIAAADPLFYGFTIITNPNTNASARISVMAVEGFFYLGEG